MSENHKISPVFTDRVQNRQCYTNLIMINHLIVKLVYMCRRASMNQVCPKIMYTEVSDKMAYLQTVQT